MKNVLKFLAKSVLVPLGLTAAIAPADTSVWNNSTNNIKRRNGRYYKNI